MAVVGVVHLVEVLSRGEFDKLVGTAEGQEVDFKSAPYRMDQPKDKWELAKDVAAFANVGGGCIVIGCQTEKHETEVVEAVTKVSEVPKNLVDVSRYQDVLASTVYPSPRGLTFDWYPPAVEKGLLLIRVPGAPEADQPLVVRRFLDEAGKEYSAVGVPRRNGDRVEWDPPERVHGALVTARMAQAFMVGAARERDQSAAKATADERATDLRAAAGLAEEPCVLLQVCAPPGTDFFSQLIGPGSIAEVGRGWEGVRRMGFRISPDREPQVTEDGLLIDSTRWYTRVSNDGWFEFAAAADHNHLGWGMDRYQRDPRRVRLNPVAAVEVIYDCFRFVQQVLAPRAARGTWKAWIRAYGFKTASAEFRVGDWGDDAVPALHDKLEKEFDLTGEPERDAFEALWRLLMIFGLSKDKVPYCRNDRVDPAALKGA